MSAANIKKIFLISFLILILVFFVASFSFARELEIKYPQAPGIVEIPRTTKTYLPDYLIYIFRWAVSISGLIIFFSFFAGGFLYLTSAGNPTQMKDAQDRVSASILGAIILFSSYLILNTINPQIIILKPTLTRVEKGVILYKDAGCPADPYETLEKLGKAQKYLTSTSKLDDFGGTGVIKSIKPLVSSENLWIKFYPEVNWGGDPSVEFPSNTISSFPPPDCLSFPQDKTALSLLLIPVSPGVYLYPNVVNGEEAGTPRVYDIPGQGQYPSLMDFNDDAEFIKLVNRENKTFGVVLHDEVNFVGECRFFESHPHYSPSTIRQTLPNDFINRASSVTVFNQIPDLPPEGKITLCKNEDCTKDCTREDCHPGFKAVFNIHSSNFGATRKELGFLTCPNFTNINETNCPGFDSSESDNNIEVPGIQTLSNINDAVNWIKIEGPYMVLLTNSANDYAGACGVFFPGTHNLAVDQMGNCRWSGIHRYPCASSMKIVPIISIGQ